MTDWEQFRYFLRLGHFEVAKLLIERGAMVNAKNKFNETPLYLAAEAGFKFSEIQIVME